MSGDTGCQVLDLPGAELARLHADLARYARLSPEDITRYRVLGHAPELAAVVQEALAALELTREEDAYAHLASFRRGDKVEVNGRAARVVYPQQSGRTIYEASLLVTGYGTDIYISVRSLLAGWHTITLAAGAVAGNIRYFDRVTYAAQNPGGAR